MRNCIYCGTVVIAELQLLRNCSYCGTAVIEELQLLPNCSYCSIFISIVCLYLIRRTRENGVGLNRGGVSYNMVGLNRNGMKLNWVGLANGGRSETNKIVLTFFGFVEGPNGGHTSYHSAASTLRPCSE